MNVGITGQSGFIGTHLYNYLKTKDDINIISYQRSFFESEDKLINFIKECDAVVHLAGMNRGPDDEIYATNIKLAEILISSLRRTDNKPHIIFSSSTHESRDTSYGRSKREARLILSRWAKKNGAKFTGLIIPNVYGPFCKPFYNSVVATFCHQLTHSEEPEVHVDQPIMLLYIDELVKKIYNILRNGHSVYELTVKASKEIMVNELLSKLKYFKKQYLDENVIPDLSNQFNLSLFNTFRSYIEHDHYPIQYDLKTDDRGTLFETVRSLNEGQAFFSCTKPGIERGNHYHRRKLERFSIIKGKALVQLRQIGTEKIIEYILDGNNPSYIDIPIHFTHNLVNIGEENLLMLFWSSELFNPEDTDTYYEKVKKVSQ